MIVDSHAHFEPRMLVLDRLLDKLKAAKVDRVALIPAMNDPLPETPEKLLAVVRTLMARSWTRRLAEMIHRTTITKGGDLKLARTIYKIYAHPDNDSVLETVAAHPDVFYGWIFLNPSGANDPLDELERCRATPGMIGIKLHPHWHDYKTETLSPIMKRAEDLGLPVLIHLGFGKCGDYRALCESFPKVAIIAAHAGIPFFSDLWTYARTVKNLYVDLSSPYLTESLVRAAVKGMGPERCLYGTDSPYGFHEDDHSYNYREIRSWVERLSINETERERVLGSTFLELIGQGQS